MGGAGLAHFAFGGLLREGPAALGGGGRQTRRRDGTTEAQCWVLGVGRLHGASKFGDGNWFPLEFWLGG